MAVPHSDPLHSGPRNMRPVIHTNTVCTCHATGLYEHVPGRCCPSFSSPPNPGSPTNTQPIGTGTVEAVGAEAVGAVAAICADFALAAFHPWVRPLHAGVGQGSRLPKLRASWRQRSQLLLQTNSTRPRHAFTLVAFAPLCLPTPCRSLRGCKLR